MASFVLYGFDTAGYARRGDRRPAPSRPSGDPAGARRRSGLAGSLLVFTALRGARPGRPGALVAAAGACRTSSRPRWGALGTPFLAVVAFSIFVCALTVHAAAVRLVFAMARDNHLPFSDSAGAGQRRLADADRCRPWSIGAAAAALLLLNANFPHVIEVMASVAVVWANLAYLFVTVPMLCEAVPADGSEPVRRRPGSAWARWGLAVNAAGGGLGRADRGQHRLAPARDLRRRPARPLRRGPRDGGDARRSAGSSTSSPRPAGPGRPRRTPR